MKTEYGRGRRDVIYEMINYCNKKVSAIRKHPYSDRKEVTSHREGLIKAYNEVVTRLEIKLEKMELIQQLFVFFLH